MMAKQYANRTDLQNAAAKLPVVTATGQTYGKATQQANAQRAVPMGTSPSAVLPQVSPPPAPGSLGAFDRPTERPNEPITAGAPFGPGVGPMGAGIPMMSPGMAAIDEVRAIQAMYGSDDLLDLLDAYGNL